MLGLKGSCYAPAGGSTSMLMIFELRAVAVDDEITSVDTSVS